ncbi:hypothetical protein D3C72_1274280 [compost metagenome]
MCFSKFRLALSLNSTMLCAIGTHSSLCPSMTTESARAMPSYSARYCSAINRAPPQAASTWNQMDSRAAMAAMAASGSMAPVSVVPAMPIMATTLILRSFKSAMVASSAAMSMRLSRSTATSCKAFSPRPRVAKAFFTE